LCSRRCKAGYGSKKLLPYMTIRWIGAQPFQSRLVLGLLQGSWNPGSYRINLIEAESRAQTYLRRIIALTGATQKGHSFVLDVGVTRFQVCDRYVRRLRDVSDPKCVYEETCFYSGFQGMPKGEQIATALLQLWTNPELFDRWSQQRDLAIKADGQVFAPVR
jgi:hypothetical protein